MSDQRGRPINYALVLPTLTGSQRLRLPEAFGSLDAKDGKPPHTTVTQMWDVDHSIYGVWRALMILFAVADGAVIVATLLNASWTNSAALGTKLRSAEHKRFVTAPRSRRTGWPARAALIRWT